MKLFLQTQSKIIILFSFFFSIFVWFFIQDIFLKMKVCNNSDAHIEYFYFWNTIFKSIPIWECSTYKSVAFSKSGRSAYGLFSEWSQKFVIRKIGTSKIRLWKNYISISDISFYEDRPIYTLHPESLTIE